MECARECVLMVTLGELVRGREIVHETTPEHQDTRTPEGCRGCSAGTGAASVLFFRRGFVAEGSDCDCDCDCGCDCDCDCDCDGENVGWVRRQATTMVARRRVSAPRSKYRATAETRVEGSGGDEDKGQDHAQVQAVRRLPQGVYRQRGTQRYAVVRRGTRGTRGRREEVEQRRTELDVSHKYQAKQAVTG